ncbi:MAG: glycosyltransferase [bacterium]|nr:glycosyltransferase [bacterium]
MKKRVNGVSIVIPVYNELKNIDKLIDRLGTTLEGAGYPFELIFIDDNSTDGTFEYLHRFTHTGTVKLYKKKGKKGKAYSLLEGFTHATYDAVAMIDADLQYPPEAIPQMIEKLSTSDIVVATRKVYKGNILRRVLSRAFRYGFGMGLFGIGTDIQSGLKLFRLEVVRNITFTPTSGWSFDLEFLYRSREAGYRISDVPITFELREEGKSKVKLLRTILDIGIGAMKLKLRRLGPQTIAPENGSMIGAGIGYQRQRYITHTTLPHGKSALRTVSEVQKVVLLLLILLLVVSFGVNTFATAVTFVAILSTIYFLDVFFNLFLIVKSLHSPSEITISDTQIKHLNEKDLPVYTVLCPLYKEAHVIPHFLKAISEIDWPKDKLDVILLLEEDDPQAEFAANTNAPSYVRTVIVPHSQPKTKPKACNYGLSIARGEYLVIYDAEDVPDPLQLKKAYIAFQNGDRSTICLQAKLNYYNPHQNLLTKFFTAEYSLWFDVTLTGLQSLNTTIPLGGTSNHFRTKDLQTLQGWDPFNVTEDADLGIRLFQQGYKTAIIDSTTLEEANSDLKNWIRQRSRWIKGYMQTYLVHMRDTYTLARKRGHHALIFHLIVGGKIAFLLINPFLWVATISYFLLYAVVGPTIESLYPTIVFYMAVISLVFGNFLFLYYYMIGAYKRGHFGLIKYVFFIPLYWLMISIAGAYALYQLVFKPHYWEKTIHGLHLKKEAKAVVAQAIKVQEEEREGVIFSSRKANRLTRLIGSSHVFTGFLLVFVSGLANVINFAFNTYIYRTLTLSEFGLVSLVGGLLAIVGIPFTALGATVSHQVGFLDGRGQANATKAVWKKLRKHVAFLSLLVTALWFLALPSLLSYFHSSDALVFALFGSVFVFGFAVSVDRGYLMGKLMFGALSVVAIIEPLAKFAFAYGVIQEGLSSLSYAAIPFSIVISSIFAWVLVGMTKGKESAGSGHVFPKKFFLLSFLTGLSTVSFVGLDIVLANHYLTPDDAGKYAFVSLVGKIVFFLGTLASQFVIPLVSRNEGQNKSSKKTMQLILLSTTLLTFIGFIVFGVLSQYTLTPFFGERAAFATEYLQFFLFAMMCFSMSRVFVFYYLAKRIYTFPFVSFLLSIVQFVLVALHHATIADFVAAMLAVAGLNLIFMIGLHLGNNYVRMFERNLADFLGLFGTDEKQEAGAGLRILFLNWRDTRHKWSGGAEVYAHEIARRLVKEGHHVTVFCGNDNDSPRDSVIDGVVIKRRGGTYLVYVWAFLYYIAHYRKNVDIVIDCENGIPFFTPLYVRKPIFLVIHHIHQEVFREHLMLPFAVMAQFLESVLMPLVYRNRPIVTVSESSKLAIIRLKISRPNDIHIVHNGLNGDIFGRDEKAPFPLFTYLGRLKAYKNIDIGIQAFAQVVKNYPKTRLYIVGFGEQGKKLKALVKKLDIERSVVFFGKVPEKEKAKILAKSWVVLQPSMMEGWGITVIEANASGTPVIASNVSGLKDAVIDGSTGVLVFPKDAKQLAKAMEDFLVDERYRTLLSRQAYIWSTHFDWDVSAEKFMRVLRMYHKPKESYGYKGDVAVA